MSRELQDKADKMIKELEDALIPISEEIKRLKSLDIEKKNKWD